MGFKQHLDRDDMLSSVNRIIFREEEAGLLKYIDERGLHREALESSCEDASRTRTRPLLGLIPEIARRGIESNTLSDADRAEIFQRLYDTWVQAEAFGHACELFHGLSNRGQRQCVEDCLSRRDYSLASRLSVDLDETLLRRAVSAAILGGQIVGLTSLRKAGLVDELVKKADPGQLYSVYFKLAEDSGLNDRFDSYVHAKGCDEGHVLSERTAYAVASAGHVLGEYDVALSIARGGLFLGFIFERCGFEVVTSKASRKGMGATWQWIDDPGRLEGARVLVLEDDVARGRTLRRCVRELERYSPSRLDLLLAPSSSPDTYEARIPKEFGSVKTIYDVPFDRFYEAHTRLVESLKSD